MLAIGGLIVLVLFGALLAPYVVDWSSFRVEFEQQASRLTGKKVSVHGDVDARILPFPSITLHDVRVGQDFDGQPQAQIARFSMDMELAPFLSGEARIFDMRIEEPRARIRVLKDGTLDWMRGSRPSIPTRVVVIEDVHIVGGQVDIADEQSGRSRKLTGISASMSAEALAGPWRGEGNATLDGEEARFSLVTGAADVAAGRLPLRLRLWPDIQPVEVNLDGELTLTANVPTYSGSFAASVLDEETASEPVTAPPPGPRVKGGFELTNDRIRIADYRLEVGALTDPYVVTGEATLDTGLKPEFLLTAEGQQIDVNHLGEGTRGKTGRNAATSAQRRLHAFVEMVASIPIPRVAGRASFKLPALVMNDTTIRDIQLDLRPAGTGWTVEKAVATLPGRTRLETSGALTLRDYPSFTGAMVVASTQPSGLADWLSGHVDPALRQLRAAGFSAKVDLTTERQQFDDLEIAVGSATLKGRIDRQSHAADAPDLFVDLSGNEIDLDAMRALASLVTGEDAGRDVLDHRLTAKLKAERFTALGMAAHQVDTAFTIGGGILALEHLKIGDIEGAKVSAQGRMEGSLLANQGAAKLTFSAADPSAFLAMLRSQLPQHPVVERLVRNASFYANTDVFADVTLGGAAGGLTAVVSGSVNGSTVAANLELPHLFNLTGSDPWSLTARLDNAQSETLLGQAGLDLLPLSGEGPGTLTLEARQPGEGAADGKLNFSTEQTQFLAEGAISLAAEDFGQGRAHVTLASENLEPYLLLTGIGIPQLGAGLPAQGQADVDISSETIALTALRGEVEGNRFDGQLSIDRSSQAFKAQGAVDLGVLDLAWLGESVFGPVADPVRGAPSAEGFAAPLGGDSDIELALKAHEFRAPGLGRVDGFAAKLGYRGGGISLEDATGGWNGGRIGGRILMSNGNGVGILQAKLAIDDADLSSVVWRKDGHPVASGRMSVSASAEASGASMRDLFGALTGSGDVRLAGLKLEGINADLLASLMTSVDTSKQEATEARVATAVAERVHHGSLDLDQAAIPFTITAGSVRVQEVKAQAGPVALTAQGQVNLAESRMDADLAFTYDPGDEALAGGDPTIRLLYSGDLDDPRERLDVAPMTNFLSMRAYEQERRRVEMLQSSVLEKQRLRREVALYGFKAAERAAEKVRLMEEERARQAMIEADRAAEEERQRQEKSLQLELPSSGADTGTDNQPVAPFGMGTLPGVGQ
jgi:uncharacterized protein involved in outer membrane biogenesis